MWLASINEHAIIMNLLLALASISAPSPEVASGSFADLAMVSSSEVTVLESFEAFASAAPFTYISVSFWDLASGTEKRIGITEG